MTKHWTEYLPDWTDRDTLLIKEIGLASKAAILDNWATGSEISLGQHTAYERVLSNLIQSQGYFSDKALIYIQRKAKMNNLKKSNNA